MTLSLTSLGGAGTVTGSKHLLNYDGRRLLVDCGLFQGPRELRELNSRRLEVEPASIDAVVLTHAHLDHSGYLPRLVNDGFDGPIYATPATIDVARLILLDSAFLQEKDAEFANRHGFSRHRPALPLYTRADAELALEKFRPGAFHEPHDLGGDASLLFRRAGHILGAATAEIHISGQTIVFSGDLGRYGDETMVDPAPVPHADCLVIESTYGDRLHPKIDTQQVLHDIIERTARRGGTILIPAFAVGRTQEVLYLLRELEDAKRIPVLPVIVDSPMAAQATQVYNRWNEEHDEEYASILMQKRHPLRTASMSTAATRDESKKLNDMRGSRIIISASGMLTGGRVLHHAMRVLPDENATIIFVGYQAAGTTGRHVLDGDREAKVMKNWIPVRCHVEKVEGFSAHADWKGVIRWLEGLNGTPKTAFTTHGEPEAAEAMAQHIRDRFGWNVEVPQYGQTVEL